jgi:hypothetical protein
LNKAWHKEVALVAASNEQSLTTGHSSDDGVLRNLAVLRWNPAEPVAVDEKHLEVCGGVLATTVNEAAVVVVQANLSWDDVVATMNSVG